MNKTTEALNLAEEALGSCDVGDYSTGHVIHPSFDDKAIEKALTAIREALAEPVKQEPVYAFRRKGLDDFCTCTKERYEELSEKSNLFEVTTFYAAPVQPVKQEPVLWGNDKFAPHERPVDAKAIRAEALEEAANVCDGWDNARDALDVYHRIAAAIRGLK